uniref:Tripartite motif containing 69 n=1 Tax=Salvator merianae TaxID=96440 RepID=A0A8D0BKJ1_SALMN
PDVATADVAKPNPGEEPRDNIAPALSLVVPDLTPDFTCPVCLEWLWEPVTLPCGHLYCQACIEMAWGSPDDNRLTCPQCREQFPEKTYTPCKLLGTLIHRIRTMDAGEAPQGRGAEADVWRRSRSRTIFSVREARKSYKVQLGSRIPGFLTCFSLFLPDFQELIHNLDFYISFLFRQLHHFLIVQEKACKAKLKEEGGDLLQEIEEKLKALREACETSHSLMMEAEEHLQLQDSASFLTVRKKQGSGCALLGKQRVTGSIPSLSLEMGNGKPLLHLYFPQITLDPETAHPCLVLSENGTCVRDGNIRQDVPDTPKRFDYCVAVLGSEGFSSGRHYWEVEVGDKPSWTLGLVNASINRKGKIDASPQKGYWVIRLRNGTELMAKSTPPEKLCPSSFPKRVGIYLDYNLGLVSFYDASTMDCLYNFLKGKFRERLFPYFCPGLYNSGDNATPLKICHFLF